MIYEIWSLGHKPFEGYTNPQVMLNGVTLSKPTLVSDACLTRVLND